VPFSNAEWEFLSTAYNDWMDDVTEILATLADAAEDAERSVEDSPVARRVVFDLRKRIKAAILEVADRVNDLTVRLARLQRD
jgi:ABC-type transporter Mla subunit MlaD